MNLPLSYFCVLRVPELLGTIYRHDCLHRRSSAMKRSENCLLKPSVCQQNEILIKVGIQPHTHRQEVDCIQKQPKSSYVDTVGVGRGSYTLLPLRTTFSSKAGTHFTYHQVDRLEGVCFVRPTLRSEMRTAIRERYPIEYATPTELKLYLSPFESCWKHSRS